jgi:hypothetical protein
MPLDPKEASDGLAIVVTRRRLESFISGGDPILQSRSHGVRRPLQDLVKGVPSRQIVRVVVDRQDVGANFARYCTHS